jgi:hypothetical protein
MTQPHQITQSEFDLKGGEILLEARIGVPLIREWSAYGTHRNSFDHAQEHGEELERRIESRAPENADAYILGDGIGEEPEPFPNSSMMITVTYPVTYVKLREYPGASE